MKEHPIIFSGPMVRSLLAGSKTQTRRKVARQPPEGIGSILCDGHYAPTVVVRKGEEGPGRTAWGAYDEGGEWGCYAPAQPGDLLWVKETWKLGFSCDFDGVRCDSNRFCPECDADEKPTLKHHFPLYRTDGGPIIPQSHPWQSPRYMPRRASRLSLRVESVRCERLHDISDADARAEGMDETAVRALWEKATRKRREEAGMDQGSCLVCLGEGWSTVEACRPRDLWRIGWTLIYGAESWDQNPLVWAYTLRRESPSSSRSASSGAGRLPNDCESA